MQRVEHDLLLLQRQELAKNVFRLDFRSEELAAIIRPGQFIEIEAGQFLRRPFGLFESCPEEGRLSIGVKVVGKGSRWLCQQSPGAKLTALGPLGNGFDMEGYERVVAVGGGSGIFPLYAALKEASRFAETAVAAGFRTSEEAFYLREFHQLCSTHCYSSDGDCLDIQGHAGQAASYLLKTLNPEKKTLLIACGPKPLLRSVQELAREYGLDAQLSLEERMACGLGLCLGCAVDLLDDTLAGGIRRVRCCVEGPVFPAEKLIL